VTVTGVGASIVEPFPSWPKPLSPQQRTVPSLRTAHVWLQPDETLVAIGVPLSPTSVGTGEFVLVPLPNCP
jgi:hypothetical protein